jgi:hypothetical protein
MQSMVLNDDLFVSELLQDLSITVTEMVRLFTSLCEKSNSHLKTYPFIKNMVCRLRLVKKAFYGYFITRRRFV